MKRYPGPDPFSKKYKNVFFGRESEKEALLDIIGTNKLTVVFGRSGLGKSSLLNAAVIPVLEQDYKIVMPRFVIKAETENTGARPSPHKLFIKKINKASDIYDFLQGIENVGYEESMWHSVKNLQKNGLKDKRGLVIIMDQFEEIFNYDEEEVRQFGIGLSEVLNNRVPSLTQKKLYSRIKHLEGLQLEEQTVKELGLIKNELQSLEQELNLISSESPVKIVIGIRSDKLSRLEEFSACIPSILGNLFEVKQLTVPKGIAAIREPAAKEQEEGPFDSVKFSYEDDAVKKIISYLVSQTKAKEQKVEGFQLQMICQRIEEMVMNNEFTVKDGQPVVTADKLPSFEKIVKNYYKEFVLMKNENGAMVFDQANQLFIRYLVEKKLVNEKNKTRLSIDQALVKPIGISEPVLEKLIDKRIIRVEPNTVSGFSYEISHDTMVKSLLDSHTELGNIDQSLLKFYKSAINYKTWVLGPVKRSDNEYQQFIMQNLLNKAGNPETVDTSLFTDPREIEILDYLVDKRIISRYNEDGKEKVELFEPFVAPAKIVNDEIESNKQRLFFNVLKLSGVAVGIIVLVALFLVMFLLQISKERNTALAFMLTTKAVSVQDKNVALRLLEKAYKLTGDTADIGKQIQNIYASGYYSKGKSGRNRNLSIPGEKIAGFEVSESGKYFFVYTEPISLRKKPEYSDSLNLQGSTTRLQRDTFSVRLYSIDGTLIKEFSNIVKANFLDNSDTLWMIRKQSNDYLLELVTPLAKIIKSVVLPAMPRPPRYSFDDLLMSLQVRYLQSSKKIVFFATQYGYSNMYNRNLHEQKRFVTFFDIENKGSQVTFDPKNKDVADVFADEDSIKILWADKQAGTFGVIDGVSGRNLFTKSLPFPIERMQFHQEGLVITATKDSAFFLYDLLKREFYTGLGNAEIGSINIIESNVYSHPYSFGSKWKSVIKKWKKEGKKLIVADSIVSTTGSYFQMQGRLIYNIPGYRSSDSTNMSRIIVYNLNMDSIASYTIDSGYSYQYAWLTFIDDTHGVIQMDLNKEYHHLVFTVLPGKIEITDKFIIQYIESDNSNFYIGRLFHFSNKKLYFLLSGDDQSLYIFDLTHKISAFDVNGILAELNDTSRTLVPKLTPEQERSYNIRRKKILGIF